MRPDGSRLTYDAAVLLVREWYAADCRHGETDADRLAARYPADPALRGRWVRQFVELADGTGISHGRCGPRERLMYWDVLWAARIVAYRIGDPLPPEFAAWIRDVRSGRRQRPKVSGRPRAPLMRDARMTAYAGRLVAAGFRRTRADSKAGPKACEKGGSAADIIAEAFADSSALSYKTVADILTGGTFRQWLRRLLARQGS